MSEIENINLGESYSELPVEILVLMLEMEDRLSETENDFSPTQELLYLIIGDPEIILDRDLDAWVCTASSTCRCSDCDDVYVLLPRWVRR